MLSVYELCTARIKNQNSCSSSVVLQISSSTRTVNQAVDRHLQFRILIAIGNVSGNTVVKTVTLLLNRKNSVAKLSNTTIVT